MQDGDAEQSAPKLPPNLLPGDVEFLSGLLSKPG